MCFKCIKETEKIEKVLYEFDICFPHLSEKISDYAFYAEKLNRNAKTYVLKENDLFIGLSVFYANDSETKCGYISLIGVKDEYRQKGYGKQLLSFTESIMKQEGMESVRLEVDNDNKVAQLFYKKMSFSYEKEASKNSMYMLKKI